MSAISATSASSCKCSRSPSAPDMLLAWPASAQNRARCVGGLAARRPASGERFLMVAIHAVRPAKPTGTRTIAPPATISLSWRLDDASETASRSATTNGGPFLCDVALPRRLQLSQSSATESAHAVSGQWPSRVPSDQSAGVAVSRRRQHALGTHGSRALRDIRIRAL